MLKAWTWSVKSRVEEATSDPQNDLAMATSKLQPIVFRGLAKAWPLVRAAGKHPDSAIHQISQFERGMPFKTMIGEPSISGRFFYDPTMLGYNFSVETMTFAELFAMLRSAKGRDDARAIYAGSNPVSQYLPGFSIENPLPISIPESEARIWIGNSTHVAPHFDVSDNIAVVALGRRRFTLFPPNQTPNLYVGPLDVTIAGQPVSMVDVRSPDLDRHPKFAAAMCNAVSADLEPGDAIYIPTMWWHCVEALDPINVLVNYWYNAPINSSPFATLIHAMMSVRDLPKTERDVWRLWFDQYVFDDQASHAADHLPLHARGVAGPPSRERSQAIRYFLRKVIGNA